MSQMTQFLISHRGRAKVAISDVNEAARRGAIVNTASIADVVAEPGVPRTGYAFLTYSGNLRQHGYALGC